MDPREKLVEELVALGAPSQKAFIFALDVGGNLGWPKEENQQKMMLKDYGIKLPAKDVDKVITNTFLNETQD